MPLFTITTRAGISTDKKNTLSGAIHKASVSAGYPEDDFFQRFISLTEDDLRISARYPDLSKPRSGQIVMIEAVLSSGTAEGTKRLLVSALVTQLQATGIDPEDVMVFLGEIDRSHSSFGGGRYAPPVCR
jgi:hypothetical protein